MLLRKRYKIAAKWSRKFERWRKKLEHRLAYRKKDKILNLNEEIRGKYLHKKCYILGNSPSLNNLDLTKLENEFVFCVNTFFVHKQFDIIKPDFYVFADPDLYTVLDEKNQYWWEALIKKVSGKGIVLFFPIQLKNTYVHEALRNEKIYFIDLGLEFNSYSVEKFNLTNPLNGVQNVLILAIQIALDLGFEELYLAGADHDWLFHIGHEQRHFYDTKETGIENVGEVGYPYNWWLDAVNTMFSQYKLIKAYADKNTRAKIFNASESGVLDVFPMVRFNDTFSQNEKNN